MIAFLLITAPALALSAWLVFLELPRQRREAAAAVARARHRGVLHGMNIGWIHHGRALAKMSGATVHGFAGECGGCGNCYGIVAQAADEYWSCSNCGHRNPAPLVADDVTTAARPRIRRS